MYLQFLSRLHIDMPQVVESVPHVRKEPNYSETCL